MTAAKDVFVHATALGRAGMRGLVEGHKVTFDTREDRRTGKIAVDNIQAAQHLQREMNPPLGAVSSVVLFKDGTVPKLSRNALLFGHLL